MKLSAGDDQLVHQLPRPVAQVDAAVPNWFDRFYFNLHPPDDGPLLVVGAGVYPNVDVGDGYVCLTAGGEQRNVRFARRLGGDRLVTDFGPFRWEVLEPLRRWRLVIDAPDEGFAADVIWTARTEPYAVDPIVVAHEDAPRTEFAHFVQSGRYEGALRIDGEEIDVTGWLGHRDRSWGVRGTRERLGMHIWIGAQLPDRCVAVHYNEDRQGRPAHIDGALLPEGGEPVPATGFAHDLTFDARGEVVSGAFRVELATGEALELEARGLGRGIYMAAAGYGGWHGRDRGRAHVEHDRWVLDDSIDLGALDIALLDKLCAFTCEGVTAAGIFELALTRSRSFEYRPTLQYPPPLAG
jgi:hypothetical protein